MFYKYNKIWFYFKTTRPNKYFFKQNTKIIYLFALIVSQIQLENSETWVYIPGWFLAAQTAPQLVTPTTVHLPPIFNINGPPESPLKVINVKNLIYFKKVWYLHGKYLCLIHMYRSLCSYTHPPDCTFFCTSLYLPQAN